jgi:RNA polymerase sigma factor (sigma-70 family)
MQPQSDAWLLREYAEHGRESAFAEITARHTNLVYSAALRQVDSPDLAAEIAQQAFIGLARGAQALSQTLAEDASLAGWLCRIVRNLSLNLRRDEFRRHSRERQAMAQYDPAPETLPDWEQLRPLLDEAMADLSETDYDAIVLRYYQQQDLRSVGRALGLSDDAAQKRVSRAVEQLRESFAKRGLTLGAGGLAAVISANAVQAAPVGLAVAISAAAVLAAATLATTAAVTATATASATATVTTAATKAIAFTALQKAAIATLLAAAVGTGIYEVRRAAQRREPNQPPLQRQAVQASPASPITAAQAVARGSGDLPPVVPISLAGVLLPAENDPWDKDSAVKAIPRGKQIFGGIEFRVEGMIQLQSKGARDDQHNYRQTIEVPLAETNVTAAGTQVVQRGSNVAAVHLLGATIYGGAGECDMAQVVWRYADGSASRSHVMFENHVRDWTRQPYETPARLPYLFSKVVWRAPVPGQVGRWVRLYRFSYDNPEPGRVIQQIEFVSAMRTPTLVVMGLTLDPVRLGERPDDSPNLEPTDLVPGAQMEVVVQTTEGLPIPNAKVFVLIEQAGGKSPDLFDKTQVTDASGIAHVGYPPAQDLQRLEIGASHEDYFGRKTGWERQAGDSIPASYTFKLGNGITLGGRVVDESEAPITGATVNLFKVWSGGEVMVRRGEPSDYESHSTSTDAQGRWQVKGVPGDLIHNIGIRASHPNYVWTKHDRQQSKNLDQELRAGTFKVVLQRAWWVVGRVIDESGNPISGATISAGKYNYADMQETKTDARGAFGFRNLSQGKIPFSALAKGRKPEIRIVEVKPEMPEVLFRLGPGQKVWGIVKAETGEPLASVRIDLESKNGTIPDTYHLELNSDKDGRFEWDGAPDEAPNFCFIKSGYEIKRRQTLKLNEENVITLRHERKIEGQVLDAATEQPVTKFRAGTGPYPGADPFYADYPGMKDYADANGRFSLKVDEAETGAVKVEADDYAAQVERLPEAKNGVVHVVLRLKPSKALQGVLVTPDGAPAAGGTVAISNGRPNEMPSLGNARLVHADRQGKVVTTDAAGEFVLPSPPEVGTVVAAQEKGFGIASIQQVRDNGLLVLQAFGRIEGTYTRGGQPVAGQEFMLRDTDVSFAWSQYKATTDENGRFIFEQVPPGECRIIRLVKESNGWVHRYGADVKVFPRQTAQVALGDSGATLTGRIRYESPPAEVEKLSLRAFLRTVPPPLPGGMSTEETRAYYQTPEGKAISRQEKTFVVNISDDGSWNVDSIPPGTYRVNVTASKPGTQQWENPPVATGTAQVVVPQGATPQTQISVDEVVLRPNSK